MQAEELAPGRSPAWADSRTAVGARRTRTGTRHVVLAVLAGALGLLMVAYLAIAGYTMNLALHAERRPLARTPDTLGLAYEPVRFAAADSTPLAGWYLPVPGSHRAIVLVHGLDGNRSPRDGYNLDVAARYVAHGYNVLLFDLRGHGESGGSRLGLGWDERADVRAAVALVEARGNTPGQIGLHGISYGAATSLLSTAVLPDVGAVLADSGFADARDLFNSEIRRKVGLPPVFTPGISWLGTLVYGIDLDAIPPLRAIAQIAPRPILLVHSDSDERIPVDHAYRLRAATGGRADLWLVPGVKHAATFQRDPDAFTAKAVGFFDAALR